MLTRMEVSNMTDTGLGLAYERVAGRLADDFARNAPGRLSDVYDLALMRLEADLRAIALAPIRPHGQLSLFDAA